MRREELRDLLAAAGLDILIEEGLSRGTERLTFKRVFDRVATEHGVRVTNASVIGRIWDSMDDYQTDVLAAALNDDDQQEVEKTLAAATTVLENADLSSRAGRKTAAIEVCRLAGGANAATLAASRSGSLYIGVRGLAVSRLPLAGDAPISKAVLAAYESIVHRYEDLIGSAFAVLGLRVKPGFTLRQLSIAAISLAEGCTLWDRIDTSSTRGILRPTGPDGETQEWMLYAVGLEALLWQFAEWNDPEPT